MPGKQQDEPVAPPLPDGEMPWGYTFDKESFEFFFTLGFDWPRSWLLALAGADHGRAQNLIRKGCPEMTAFEILL